LNSKFYLETDSESEKKLDKETIIKIRNGDSEALDSIMNKYRSFVYSRAKPFFIVGAEKEDIIQEGMIGLFKAIKGFDINKEVSFKAFADLCVRRQIITAIKCSTRQKHMPLNSYLSLNKCAFDEDGDRTLIEVLDFDLVPDPLETVANKETYKKIELKMGQVLSDFEQQVFNGYLNGDSYVEIANNLDTHVKAVDNAIQRIKKKVEKHILNDIEMM
jgi:RNA polymerase sporulation-specific sigma factor